MLSELPKHGRRSSRAACVPSLHQYVPRPHSRAFRSATEPDRYASLLTHRLLRDNRLAQQVNRGKMALQFARGGRQIVRMVVAGTAQLGPRVTDPPHQLSIAKETR